MLFTDQHEVLLQRSANKPHHMKMRGSNKVKTHSNQNHLKSRSQKEEDCYAKNTREEQ